jgi:hypothetical protein
MHLHTYIHTHVHTYIHVYTYTHTHIYIYIYTYIHTYRHTLANNYLQIWYFSTNIGKNWPDRQSQFRQQDGMPNLTVRLRQLYRDSHSLRRCGVYVKWMACGGGREGKMYNSSFSHKMAYSFTVIFLLQFLLPYFVFVSATKEKYCYIIKHVTVTFLKVQLKELCRTMNPIYTFS